MTRLLATEVRGAQPSSAGVSTTVRPIVEIRYDLDLAAEDAAALDDLIDSHPHVGVFLSRAWLSGFFAEPPDGCDPALVVVRERGTLRGIVPIATRRTLTHVRVALLGGGAGSDRVDLMAARGYEAACSDAFLDWLEESFGAKGFGLELRDVPGTSPLWGAVHRAGIEQRLRLALEPREIHALPYLDLAEPRWREASPARRSNSLDKHRRWLERRGRLRIEILQDAGEAMAAFESLVRLLHARWYGQGDGSVLDKPRLQRFHRRVIPLLLQEGRLRMIRLSADMRTIAIFYGLAGGPHAAGAPSGAWWGYYLAGYDREWAGRIHLGQITLATVIDLASEQGAVEFDFLKGADRVKYLWPVRERVTVDADVYSGRSGPQLIRATRATRDAAVALAKSARNLFPTHRRP